MQRGLTMNWLEKASQFSHPADVPQDFAMAVYKIMHSQAGYEEWELIDRYLGEQKPIFDWIQNVLTSNNMEPSQVAEELQWWKQQISRPYN